MQEAEIYSGLTNIFHDIFNDDSIVLRPDLTADDVADWDSFSHINLIVTIESRFGKICVTSSGRSSVWTAGIQADRGAQENLAPHFLVFAIVRHRTTRTRKCVKNVAPHRRPRKDQAVARGRCLQGRRTGARQSTGSAKTRRLRSIVTMPPISG